jgi:TolA-binding protein
MYSRVEGSSPTHVSALSAALQVAGELAELQTVTAQQAARLAQLTQQLQQGQEELAASRAQQDATQQQLQQREAELAGQVGPGDSSVVPVIVQPVRCMLSTHAAAAGARFRTLPTELHDLWASGISSRMSGTSVL